MEAADAHRRDRPGEAGEAEEADLRLAVVEGRVGEEEGERRPDQAEAGEATGAEDHPPAQQRLAADQRADAAEQGAVAERGRGAALRQRPPEGDPEHRHRHRGEGEDGAPAGDAGDQAGEGAGEKDAGQQAAHHHADDGAAFPSGASVLAKGTRIWATTEVAEAIPIARARTANCGAAAAPAEAEAADRQQGGDELAAVDQVAERGEEDEPEAVEDLGDRDQQAGGAVGDAEVRGRSRRAAAARSRGWRR